LDKYHQPNFSRGLSWP